MHIILTLESSREGLHYNTDLQGENEIRDEFLSNDDILFSEQDSLGHLELCK